MSEDLEVEGSFTCEELGRDQYGRSIVKEATDGTTRLGQMETYLTAFS